MSKRKRRHLSAEIKLVSSRIKWLNMVGMPVLVLLVGLGVSGARRWNKGG